MSEPGARPARPVRPWPDERPADRQLVERLNEAWRLADTAPGPSLRNRLAARVRRLLARALRPQEIFNSLVVQQLNYLTEAHVVAAERHAALRAMIEDTFHRTELLFDHLDHLSRRLETGLAAIEEGLDDVRRAPEAFAARQQRVEAGLTALRELQGQLQTAVGVLQHQTQRLAKDAERRPAAAPSGTPAPAAPAQAYTSKSDVLSHKYVGFEDAFRGSPEAIRAGLAAYVPLFSGASDVLDVGCGRGEFLSLLREHGVRARGVDLNEAMVEVCRESGLEAETADAVAYLRALPDGALGGIFAAQVVEHLTPGYLAELLDTAFDKLRPGGLIVLETINPGCWFAFFESYIRDITHEQPLHPDTLRYLLVASGFQDAEIRYSAPYPEFEKLQPVAAGVPADIAETLNANVEKVNRLLFTYLDYAAIARRP